jgi:hypothetical protein
MAILFHFKIIVIDGKLVYKIKHKADGSVDLYKAHLVAKVFKQRLVINYDDTFSPIVKPATIRLVLSITVSQDWTLHQLNVQNALLHNVLEEDVFLKQRPGFVNPQFPSYHCKLGKVLYGLKQTPQPWYSHLSDKLHSLGFKSSKADISLFLYHKGAVTMFMMSMLISSVVDALLRDLNTDFALKDLGPLQYFLGIQVKRTVDGLSLS